MKKLLIAGIATAAFYGAPALAADLPVKAPAPAYVAPAPIFNWSGFYFGGNVGAGWASNSSFTMTDPLGSFAFNPLALSAKSQSSFLGGIQAGYNWQASPNWVVGLEADWSWTGLKLKANSPITNAGGIFIPTSNAFTETDVNGIGSIRGRIGYTTPTWMLYATGGWAYTDLKDSGGWTCNLGLCSNTFNSLANFTKNASGWVVGAGTEMRSPGSPWIFGVEYLFYDLNASASGITVLNPGAGGCAAGSPCNPVTFGNFNVQEVRVRLSYKFGDMGKAPVVAKY